MVRGMVVARAMAGYLFRVGVRVRVTVTVMTC
jgi:hypothetical protein